MLDGNALGYILAQAMISPTTSPENRAMVEANWKLIATIICDYIKANATVMVPESVVIAPSPNITLATAAGPCTGAVIIPKNVGTVL